MSQYNTLQEEELKLRIAEAFFAQYDCNTRIGKIDFCAVQKQKAKRPRQDGETVSLLWAEAKRGIVTDIYKPLVQLILTIGKARTFETYLPPPFLAAFDAEKIAFIPYKEILPFFSLNDFNWNVAPSDERSREFGLLYDAVKATLDKTAYLFRYDVHVAELREFIKQHLSESSELIQINKNNFVSIYQRWLSQVQPSIDVNWEVLKKNGLIDGDFFLADLLSHENLTIKEKLFVLLQNSKYIVDRKVDAGGIVRAGEVFFKDRQKSHSQFWSLYQRPPREEYWDYIINRRDLLVPQDVRERKGSFFTPKIWVDLSQKYLADVLGENWQDEYYVWDCAAGTGNLLNGLTNKYNIWASTLDQQDVDVMKDRIKNGASLLESHVFQFDFLNDEFDCGKLPVDLLEVLQNPEKRKKLVVYINPPYAETSNKRLTQKDRKNKREISFTAVRGEEVEGKASRELFVQFIMKIYEKLRGSKLAQFSTSKIVLAPNFSVIRKQFNAKLESCFLVPAYTFDNVKGDFPIGFFIWDTNTPELFTSFMADVYNENGEHEPFQKKIMSWDDRTLLNLWYVKKTPKTGLELGYLSLYGNDFQHNNMVYIVNRKNMIKRPQGDAITASSLFNCCICLSVRHTLAKTWLNDRDQFYAPLEEVKTSHEFKNDCLTFTLFHGQNRITSAEGTNHWIPFTEQEVKAQSRFTSHFMTDFISGQLAPRELRNRGKGTLCDLAEGKSFVPTEPLVFSPEATAVFDAGRELWRYYHAQPNANPNASYYDIRLHFQKRNEKGKMNPKSDDVEYMRLLANLKEAMEALRLKIVPKVYEYGFLIE